MVTRPTDAMDVFFRGFEGFLAGGQKSHLRRGEPHRFEAEASEILRKPMGSLTRAR
jgi:hypothetical protein